MIKRLNFNEHGNLTFQNLMKQDYALFSLWFLHELSARILYIAIL